ncbi:MAG: hypothetical protein IH623_11100 [Verrucomicrobia bacterium]|nr:hypothetical protein [Verrucomicrobiota bacterium]
MNKSRNGSYVLGGLVALQVCSLPALVDSDRMLRFATHALLGYVAFAVVLLLFAARSARPLGFRPRFWTLANLATLILLGIAMWAAWDSNYRPLEVTTAAAALVGALIHLFRCNARKPDCVQQSHPPR